MKSISRKCGDQFMNQKMNLIQKYLDNQDLESKPGGPLVFFNKFWPNKVFILISCFYYILFHKSESISSHSPLPGCFLFFFFFHFVFNILFSLKIFFFLSLLFWGVFFFFIYIIFFFLIICFVILSLPSLGLATPSQSWKEV